ncbi:MAG: flagellar hook-associated protein FlgK [Nitrospiraceae bacterium]|nr:flagellar hook-associated protein FlgK [Nitrospiraceae bacterium]
MGLFSILNIADSALYSSQAAIATASNNIANANTPGYDTETTVLAPVDYINVSGANSGPANYGGVAVSGVQRQYDSYLQSQIYQQQQSLSSSDSSSNILGQVEQAFNETGDTGLATYYNNFVDAWQQVAGNPADTSARTVLISDAQALAGAAQDKQNTLQAAVTETNNEIAKTVTTVNNLASQIADVNKQIGELANPTDGSDIQLRDQRDNLMTQLSQYIGFSYYEDSTGRVTIISGMQNLVSGDQTNALSVKADSNGDNQLYLNGINITSNVQKGSLGGLIAARSDAETQGIVPLKRFVAALVQQVNKIQEQGYDLNGTSASSEPFFTPLSLYTAADSQASITASVSDESQLTLDDYEIKIGGSGSNLTYSVYDSQTGGQVGSAGSYSSGGTTITLMPGISATISGAAAAGDTFSISPTANSVNDFSVALTDGSQIAAAQTANSPGDNSNALAMVNMLQGGQVSGLGGDTLMGYYQGIVAATGTLSKAASDSQTFNQNLLDQLNQQRDSTSGVSLDDQAIDLIKFQQAYQAGAKVIETTQQLLQTLINM